MTCPRKITWSANDDIQERPTPAWGDEFPSLGLPNEERGRISIWAGDPSTVKNGSSVSIVWGLAAREHYHINFYHPNGGATHKEVSDLLEVLALCLDHFNRHPIVTLPREVT